MLICSPQHMRAKGYEFHNGHNSLYFTGDYDSEKHTFEKDAPVSLDYGLDFYAPQTFTSPDGRKILFAWMSRMEEEEEKLFGEGESSIHCMTLPREISYRNGELCQLPVRELEKSLCIHKISEQERQSG